MAGMRQYPKDLQDAPVYGRKADNLLPAVSVQNSAFDPAYARKIGEEAYRASTDWLNSSRRKEWANSLRAFQGLHPNGSKYLSDDYRYRSRLYRPKTRTMVRKAEANTAFAFFSNEDVVRISPQDDNDQHQKASAELMQALLQHRLTKTIPWFLTLVGARQDAEVTGICIGKVYWKFKEREVHSGSRQQPALNPETGLPILDEMGNLLMEEIDLYDRERLEDHPGVDLIAAENFRFEPGADWRDVVATSPYLIELIPMYVADVQSRVDKGEWLPVSPGALRNATSLDDDSTRHAREQGRIPGKTGATYKPQPFDICWVRETIIREGGDEAHFYSLNGGGELLSNPRDLKEVYLQGLRPYVCGFVVPEAHKTYPSAKVELIRDIQTKANDIDNLRLDNVKLALNPRQFVSAGYGLDPQDLRTFMPGKVNITNGKVNIGEVVAWDRPPEVTASAYAEQDRVDMDFDELAGGLSHATIRANKGVFDAQGNTELLAGNSSQVEEYEQRVFAETFVEKILRHLVKLEQAYETDAVVLALAGNQAQLIQKFGINEITDFLLQQELTIKVNVGIGATNPKLRLNNFLTAATAISKMFGPAAALGADFKEISKEVFGLCGYKDGERFFLPDFNIQEAMQQLASKGDDKDGDAKAKATEQAAEAARQREQDMLDMQKQRRQHEYKMIELKAQSDGKQQETGAKIWLELQKSQLKQQAEINSAQHLAQMASRPATTIQFNAEDMLAKTAQNVERMAGGQTSAFKALQQILAPVSQAAVAMSDLARASYEQTQENAAIMREMLAQGAKGNETLAQSIESLARAQLAPRRGRRDRDGTLISEVIQ